ncbi:MAG: TadE/TadG family type IV pilus assembly protein [Geminicoccaceae bacterium]
MSPLAALARGWRRFRACRRGSIPVEMALVTPVLLTMLLGVVDVGWYLVMQHKMARVAATVADLTSRGETITEAQLRDIFAAARTVAEPFDIDSEGRAIVSSITNPGGAGARIAWQRLSPHGLDIDSRVGAPGEAPVLPDGFAVQADENIVAAEAFLAFQPIVGLILRGQQDIYVRAVQRPRLGTLDQVNP